MSPTNPQDPEKGKPFEDVQAGEDAKEAAELKAQTEAEEASEQPSPQPASDAEPQAEGTAAAATGVDKAAAAATGKDGDAAEDAGRQDRGDQEAARAADEGKRSTRRSRGRRSDQPKAVPVGLKVSAQAKYVRTSARKARIVCDHIRGKDVVEARAILAFTPRGAAKPWLKLLESAVANAEHNHELVGEDLRIFSVHADEGPTLKRFRPRAMGRATRIRKRTSHLTITLTPKES